MLRGNTNFMAPFLADHGRPDLPRRSRNRSSFLTSPSTGPPGRRRGSLTYLVKVVDHIHTSGGVEGAGWPPTLLGTGRPEVKWGPSIIYPFGWERGWNGARPLQLLQQAKQHPSDITRQYRPRPLVLLFMVDQI